MMSRMPFYLHANQPRRTCKLVSFPFMVYKIPSSLRAMSLLFPGQVVSGAGKSYHSLERLGKPGVHGSQLFKAERIHFLEPDLPDHKWFAVSRRTSQLPLLTLISGL
jgi:hypothetical protein